MEYRANFLWGFPDDSIESLGYEFANAKTEPYQKECWDALVQKFKEQLTPKETNGNENPLRFLSGFEISIFKNTSVQKGTGMLHINPDDYPDEKK